MTASPGRSFAPVSGPVAGVPPAAEPVAKIAAEPVAKIAATRVAEPDPDLFTAAGLALETVPETGAEPPPAVVLRQIEVEVFPDGTMTRENAARYLGISRHTLATWAHLKTGPRYMKLRRKSYYRKSDLDDWKAEQFT